MFHCITSQQSQNLSIYYSSPPPPLNNCQFLFPSSDGHLLPLEFNEAGCVSFAFYFSNNLAPPELWSLAVEDLDRSQRTDSSCLSYHEVSDCPVGHIIRQMMCYCSCVTADWCCGVVWCGVVATAVHYHLSTSFFSRHFRTNINRSTPPLGQLRSPGHLHFWLFEVPT